MIGAPDVSVVIVSYNVRAFLDQALRSVERASGGLAVETWVVDNASRDGSAEMVAARFPSVRLIASKENLGFGKANNLALRQATGRTVLLLNPDTIVEEDALRTLVAFLDAHPKAGAVGPTILNPDGSFAPESRRGFPTPEVALYKMTGLSRLFPASPRFGRYHLSFLPKDRAAEVDALSGSCLLARADALRAVATGSGNTEQGDAFDVFDPAFFMYGEDLDLCYRLQQGGWQVWFEPSARIVHYKGESTKKGDVRYVRHFYGAMERFAAKHFRQKRGGALLLAAIRAAILVRAALGALRRVTRRLALPVADALLALAALALGALLHPGGAFPWSDGRFLATVGVVFALSSAIGIALAGGYRAARRTSLPMAVVGAAAALVGTASLSFFVKAIAFSRFAVLAGAALALPLLALPRLARRRRARAVRRAVVLGSAEEAARLLDSTAPFVVAGFVDDAPPPEASAGGLPERLPYLGRPADLATVLAVERATDLVFGPSVSAAEAFALMQALRDADVEFRMLAPGGTHLIGKARVDVLGVG